MSKEHHNPKLLSNQDLQNIDQTLSIASPIIVDPKSRISDRATAFHVSQDTLGKPSTTNVNNIPATRDVGTT